MNSSRAFRLRGGFTLVELLVSMVIVALLVVMLVTMTNSVGRVWSQSAAKAEEFRDAREAFDSIVRKMSEATLNPYLDYVDVTGTFRTSSNTTYFQPASYKRRSELRFISGNAATLVGASNYSTSAGGSTTYLASPHAIFFQAPLGSVNIPANASASTLPYLDLGNVINTVGYFIEYGDDSQLRPDFITPTITPLRYRFRLMEMVEPSDTLSVYKYTSGSSSYVTREWLTDPFNEKYDGQPARPVSVLAENIVALILLPQLTPADQTAGGYTAASLAPNYLYDSTGTGMNTVTDPKLNPTNQLPPVVQVTMVAVDEASIIRSQAGTVTPSTMPTYAAGLFTDPTNFATDINRLQANLLGKTYMAGGNSYTPTSAAPIALNYRIFTTNVSIKAAKWSNSQKN